MEYAMNQMLRQGGVSVLVTSVTVAFAVLINLISDVTVVRCFAVFTGMWIIESYSNVLSSQSSLVVLKINMSLSQLWNHEEDKKNFLMTYCTKMF